MKRLGLGSGKGKGYYNLVPIDSHIHSMSARGITTTTPIRTPLKTYYYKDLPIKHRQLLESLDRRIEQKKLKWVSAVLHNDEISTDRDMVKYLMAEGLSKDEAQYYIKQREKALSDPHYDVKPYYSYSMSAKAIKDKYKNYYDKFYKLRQIRKDEQRIEAIGRGFALPTIGAVGVRSASALVGLGFDAGGATIPIVGLAVGGLLGALYLEERAWAKKVRSLKAKGFKKIQSDWVIDKKNILNTHNIKTGEKLQKFNWHPVTNEIIMGGNVPHVTLLREKGENQNINEWVRGFYEPSRNKLFIRHYFNPKSRVAEFTSKSFDLSEKMQAKLVKKLKEYGLPADVKIEYNVDNQFLHNEGFIHV